MTEASSTESSIRPTKSFDDAPLIDESASKKAGAGGPQRQTRTYSLDVDASMKEGDEAQDIMTPLKARSNSGDEDHELRVAKELAMAIAQNPNLTPAELKDLQQKAVASTAQTAQTRISSSAKHKSPLLKSISKGVKSGVKKALSPMAQNNSSANKAAASSSIKLADFLELSAKTPTALAGFGMDSSENEDTLGGLVSSSGTAGNIRITGIIWKRRSGLGKYSTSAAWERRRLVLRGGNLYYYRTNVDHKDDEMSVGPTDVGDHSGEFMIPDGIPPAPADSTPSKSKSWFLDPMGTHSKSSKGDARGYLDLIKDNTSVGASFGHSGAPTPFALSVKVLAQTKWKLCFDTHAELMQWLAALSDVIVQGSVDTYNSQILAANDPTSKDSHFASANGQLSEPPLIANSGKESRVGGHRLWVAGHYKVQSENYPAQELENVSERELEGMHSDDDDDDDDDEAAVGYSRGITYGSGTTANKDLFLELEGGREVWGIPSKHLWRWGTLWNAAIIVARGSSTTVELFWYLITFANIVLFGLMTKEVVGGTIKPSLAVSRKLARRCSSGVSIHDRVNSAVSSGGKETHGNADSQDNAATSTEESGIRPKAGTTGMRIENATDLPVNKDGHVFAGWRYADPSMMKVRSHNYKKDKIKVPSPGEMYKCVHVDIFESRKRLPDMSSRVELPTADFKDEGPKTWNAPDTFVVSIAIPTDPPKLYSSSEDGGGYTVTMYFVMHQETRDLLRKVTADGYNPKDEELDDMNKSKTNAVRLLDEWCRRAPTDDEFCARFKVLPNAQNLKEIGMPNWIGKYNGKPFLIKRPGQTGFLYRHPDKSCVEFDISLHPFPYLAKQGICFMKDAYFKKVLVTFGFLIEGRAEDELPECLIGLMQLCYPDPTHAIQGEDLMAGKSPKSFE